MKSVFSSHASLARASLAHAWNSGNVPHGRAGDGRMFFRGPQLFSYGDHYTIAFRLSSGDVLVNATRYSPSTSAHTREAEHAASNRRLIPVPQLSALADYLPHSAAGTIPAAPIAAFVERNIAAMTDEAAAYLFELAGKRDGIAATKRAREAAARRDRDAKELAVRKERVTLLRNVKKLAELSPADWREWLADVLADSHCVAETRRYNWRAGTYVTLPAYISGRGPDSVKFLRKALTAAKKAGRTVQHAKAKERLAELQAELVKGLRTFRFRDANKATRAAIRDVRAWLAAPIGLGEGREGYAELYKLAHSIDAIFGASNGRAARIMGKAGTERLLEIRREALAAANERGTELRARAEAESARRRAEQVARMEREAAERAEREKESRASWLAGTGPRLGRYMDSEGRALLRAVDVERDAAGSIVAGTLETSWGADVPLLHALKAFRFLKLCHDSGRTWNANGRTIRVGFFTIDSVTPEGFSAGCHSIGWNEVARLAAELDVADLPADDSALVARQHA